MAPVSVAATKPTKAAPSSSMAALLKHRAMTMVPASVAATVKTANMVTAVSSRFTAEMLKHVVI